MTEQEMLERIRRSAEVLEVPESLSPEKILERCRNLEQEKAGEKKSGKKLLFFRNPKLTAGLSAAAVFIICCISLMSRGGIDLGTPGGMPENSAAMDMAVATEAGAVNEESAVQEAAVEGLAEESAGAGAGGEA